MNHTSERPVVKRLIAANPPIAATGMRTARGWR